MPPKKKAAQKGKGGAEGEAMTRIAIVSSEKCKPKKCQQQCKRQCPVVRLGKQCVEVSPTSKISYISEELCIGCGICVKKCPFDAINIINLPKNLESNTSHRYGPNSFKLHRLPMPRPGQVLGLVGTNGIGKSTALQILAAKRKPNLGRFDSPPDWQEILKYYRGSALQDYFTRILEEDLKALIKPQYVDHIPRAVKGKVGAIINKKDQKGNGKEIMDLLDLTQIQNRDVALLSGGELQRFAIAVCLVQKADVYMFDEPSSYLDVRQRLVAASAIRSTVANEMDRAATTGEGESKGPKSKSDAPPKQSYCMVVEHDLAVLDYMSDYMVVLYGKPSVYGVVTMPFSVREGINIFLAGFVPTENLRFRDEALTFKVSQSADERNATEAAEGTPQQRVYPAMTKTMQRPGHEDKFVLNVEAGNFNESEIVVLLGENGTGKTTFIRMLAGLLASDEFEKAEEEGATYDVRARHGVPVLNISYKPQKIAPRFTGTVRQLLHKRIREAYVHPQFISDVMRPMKIEAIIDQDVQNLSGGELQRVAITLCLGKPADVYLLDEPSAYLDSEQRIVAAKVIKRFIMHAKKTAFVVEHDFIMATYLADRVVVYTGQPSVEATATTPQPLLAGMNQFLSHLKVTFRRDPTNYRPRINKAGSQKDAHQKSTGQFFFMDDDDAEAAKAKLPTKKA